MKAKFDYKSKKTIIIAIIVLALIVITGIGVGLFLKGNNDAEAVGNNTVGNTIDNNAGENTSSNNQTGITDSNNAVNTNNNENAGNTANDGENANNNENVENGDNVNNGGNGETVDNNANNDANNNQNGNNVTMQEFITERIEVIPERVIAENYWVTWEPTKFETLVSGEISLEKANIVAEKTVAKLTANGLEQNPESVKVGEILQYTITLTNTNSKINGLVNVTDEIPAGTEFIAATETNLKTTPAEYENASEVTKLEWKNVKVEAGSEVTLLVYVKVVAKAENEDTTAVQNTAKIYDGTTPVEDVPSPETKVANITSEKTSKVIYNEQKPHEHIVVDGIEPLHEQDIIEYTITLANVGEAAGTVKVSDTVPEGTTLIKDGVVTVVDLAGTTTYEIDELVEGIDVTVAAATEGAAGIATVTFSVIVNSFETETKQIVNDMAKVDEEPTNPTEDEAEKVYIDIPVTKVWANMESDAAQVYSVDSIKFQVKNGETVVAEKVVALEADTENEIAGGWKYTFENLPKYDANGNEITYTVVESAANADEQEILDTYYDANIAIERDLATANVTITNTFNPSKLTDKVNIPATKVWANIENDAAQVYSLSSIKLQLLGNNQVVREQVVTAEDNWKYLFEDLTKYDDKGEIIEYTIAETVANPEDEEKLNKYTVSIEQETGVITNTFNTDKVQDDLTELTVTKVWKNMTSDAAQYYAISSITLQVKLNGEVLLAQAVTAEQDWTHTFTGLKKYDENGNKLVYTVDEVVTNSENASKLEVYDKEIVGNTITNTFNPDKVQDDTIELTASKVWKNIESDAAKIYAITSIKLQVLGNGKVVAEQVVAETADSENGIAGEWKYTFTNLPKYDEAGNAITYTVAEAVVNEADQAKLDKYTVSINQETGVITNTFAPSKLADTVTVPASKVWANMGSDAAKAYAISSIKLQVLVGDTVIAEQVVAETTDEANGIVGGWAYTFTNLPEYDADGNKITYTVGEAVVNEEDKSKLKKYNTTIDQETGIITNTFDLSKVKDETTELTITKVWEDNLNAYNTRPDSVTLTLSNGTNYTLAGDKNAYTWTQTISNLPKYDANGNAINYTVTEANVPSGYTKVSESGLNVTNRANVIVEKSAYKANEDGTIGSEVTESNVFKADDTVYYKLTFKNAGNTVIDTKTLTDILPLRIELVAIDGTEITDSTTNGTDSNGYTWTLSTNAEGNTVINWTLTQVEAGATKELTIKAKVVAEAEYKDLCQKVGETTSYEAKLFVRKDGEVPYEGSGTSHGVENYTNSLGTVYLTSSELFYDTEANLKNDDLYYLIKNNNEITDMVSKGITRAELEDALSDNGITLATDEVVIWYVIKLEEGYHIDGVIRKISDLTTINNAVYMDNVKQDDVTIELEDIEIGQRGTVTVNVTSTTTANVTTPMDVVFVIDTSGSMQGTNATNMVNAVNSSIKTIMEKSPDTRIGVVGFSGNRQNTITNSSTIIPLGNYGKDKDYLSLSNNTISPTSTITGYSRNITGGTNTQAGIKAGAEMLTSQSTTTFTTTANGVTVTGTRTPVLILVTDGEPTYYYGEEAATGTRNGNGSEDNTDENYYYWTIRTAKYYKDAITSKYYAGTTKQAKMFTIGIGMSGTSATTMLNPNQTNVDACKNSNDNSEAKRLYNLLNTNQTPYAYSYADASKTGQLTQSDIESFLTSSLTGSGESMVVRAITTEESKARRINLTNLDTTKAFSLEIIGEETLSYASLSAAQTAGYVKLDSETNIYYVDLSSITRDVTVNINYWEQ